MTYEYLCTACNHVWEQEQSISAAPLKVCPNCGKETAKRQVSGGAGFILKGGGWYSDLYSSTSKKAGDSNESSGGDAKTSETKKSDATSTTGKDASSSSGGSSSGGSSSGGSSSGGSSSGGSKGGADSSAA